MIKGWRKLDCNLADAADSTSCKAHVDVCDISSHLFKNPAAVLLRCNVNKNIQLLELDVTRIGKSTVERFVLVGYTCT